VFKNDKLDFDRDLYLEQYRDSDIHTFMSSVANTQMFEQVDRLFNDASNSIGHDKICVND
jgi:hypothetical protein